MLPWGHAAVGYLAYSLRARRASAPVPGLWALVALVVGTQGPDLVDKPLSWTWGVLEYGASLGHSALTLAAMALVLLAVTRGSRHREVATAFLVGWATHVLADVVDFAWHGLYPNLAFLGWPLTRAPVTDTAPSIVPRLLNHDATAPFALLQWAAVGLAVVVWLDDGAPGVPVGRTTRADGGTGRGRGRRLRSLAALLELGVARVAGRLRGPDARRVQLSVAGVAIAVLLMTTVTGVSLGLASQSAVQSESVDYWVVPEDRSVSTVAVSAGGTRLGDAHAVRSRLAADDRVDYATPVLVQVVSVSNPATGASEYLLLVGVVPPDAGTPSETVAGLSSRALAPGDPHYANGTYDGPWTGDLVLSDAGASLLNASDGAALTARTRGTTRNLTVRNVSRADVTTGLGQAPVGLVHLSELQTLSGAAAGDQADQFLVSTNAAGVASSVESVYPGTSVVTRTGFAVRSMSESGLPLAIAVAALVTALVVGTLYVATIMGLEVTADRRELATLAALGFADRSRTLLVVVQTETVALLGGVLGVGLGYGASHLLNAVAARHLGVASVVRFDPILVAYGVGVALLIGLVAAPYPIYLSRRTDVCAELSR